MPVVAVIYILRGNSGAAVIVSHYSSGCRSVSDTLCSSVLTAAPFGFTE